MAWSQNKKSFLKDKQPGNFTMTVKTTSPDGGVRVKLHPEWPDVLLVREVTFAQVEHPLLNYGRVIAHGITKFPELAEAYWRQTVQMHFNQPGPRQ